MTMLVVDCGGLGWLCSVIDGSLTAAEGDFDTLATNTTVWRV
jgi:hypothetical protein